MDCERRRGDCDGLRHWSILRGVLPHARREVKCSTDQHREKSNGRNGLADATTLLAGLPHHRYPPEIELWVTVGNGKRHARHSKHSTVGCASSLQRFQVSSGKLFNVTFYRRSRATPNTLAILSGVLRRNAYTYRKELYGRSHGAPQSKS